jgi:CRP/FNR family transcriptional regulator, cyclic AMP receptor protein
MDQRLLDALKDVPVFREVDIAGLTELARLARARVCRPHEVVVRQGDQGDCVFIISTGFLKVCVAGPSGSMSTLCVVGPGEIFGELSLLDGGPRSATVTAITRSELVALDRGPFLEMLAARPRVSIAIMEVLARRVRRLSERFDDLTGMRVGSRLAKQLLLLAENHAHQLGLTRLRLGVKLSQRELGELVGATRESVNKNLSALRDGGAVADDGGYVVITNLDLLRSIAAN